MRNRALAPRLSRLPRTCRLGLEVPVAVGLRARLLGLTGLEPERAGRGLLIPRCRSVHTFGMRFPLDLFFLRGWRPVAARYGVPPGRLCAERRADAVLELVVGGADFVGQRREFADFDFERHRDTHQGRVARVAHAALHTADLGEVDVAGFGQRLYVEYEGACNQLVATLELSEPEV